jgi:hypothetical protein
LTDNSNKQFKKQIKMKTIKVTEQELRLIIQALQIAESECTAANERHIKDLRILKMDFDSSEEGKFWNLGTEFFNISQKINQK